MILVGVFYWVRTPISSSYHRHFNASLEKQPFTVKGERLMASNIALKGGDYGHRNSHPRVVLLASFIIFGIGMFGTCLVSNCRRPKGITKSEDH
jgi:hypothetical protein